jgi:hypothetical protein
MVFIYSKVSSNMIIIADIVYRLFTVQIFQQAKLCKCLSAPASSGWHSSSFQNLEAGKTKDDGQNA